MKADLTEVAFILDRSGSMLGLVDDTIGGFNSFIEQQKKEDGECRLTTVLFDDKYEILHDHVDIKEVKELTRNEYSPRGMTALLDAIGKTINTIGERLAKTDEKDRPEKVIVAITTDGHENSSQEFVTSKIKEMIDHQEKRYSWEFLFLGANIDSFGEAGSMGINLKGVANYEANALGTSMLYSSVANFVSDVRKKDARAVSMSMNDYMTEADEDIKKQKATSSTN